MLGSQAVKQYFSTGKSHYVVPNVSIEWNYNLFYSPYITTNGDGSLITSTNSWTDVSKWSFPPTLVSQGKVTSVFKSDASLTTRTCLSFSGQIAGSIGHGKSTISIPVTSGTDAYKVIFFAKVASDVDVNLTALTYIDTHRSHSQSQLIDSVNWTKFEVYVSARPLDTAYSSFNLTLDYTSRDENVPFTILVDRFQMYKTTDFEYQYGNLWKTSAPFTFFRPGESYVPSGSALAKLPTDFRMVKNKFDNTTKWTNQLAPCSPVVFHPKLVGGKTINPLFKNGYLSEFTEYKYFVADKINSSISAVYDEQLYSNKIVIKFNLSYSTPSAFSVKLISNQDVYGAVTENFTYTKNLTNADISSAGVCILYRQADGTWKSAADNGSWNVMPQFNLDGSISNSQAINKIVVTQTNAIPNPNYTQTIKRLDGTTTSITDEMKRMQVIEVSPRLELDVSKFTMSVTTNVQMDNKQNPLPISAISSNSATVDLSNVPLTVSNNVLSIFSNNSSSSPLKGLFRKNVKFYINYIIKDSVSGISATDAVIAGGVYYADTWDGRDIERTSVSLYDISKYLQMLAPTDYVSQSEDVFMVISNILDFAGFTDYDYDQLKHITSAKTVSATGEISKNTSPIKMQYFYCDGKQQKVFDVLREIFEVYQIGAYIDSYGVMKFLSLDNILNNTKPDMLLHDSKSTIVIGSPEYSNSLSVTSNIVQDTYTESIKSKVGKATMRYKTPQISKTVEADKRLLNGDQYVNYDATYIQSTNTIWNIEKADEATTFNTLGDSITTLSQNFFQIDPSELNQSQTNNFRQFDLDHEGFAIIEGEIVSFKDKEVVFSITQNNPNTNGVRVIEKKDDPRIVSNSSDLQAERSEIIASSGINGSVSAHFTGRIMNVERGLFNTPVRQHIVMKQASDIFQKLTLQSGSQPSINYSHNTITLPSNGNESILVAKDEVSHDYNTFSTKMRIGSNSGNAAVTGLQSGLVLYSQSNTQTAKIYIKQTAASGSGKTKKAATYEVCAEDGLGNTLLADGFTSYDITKYLENDAAAFPAGSPFEDFGKYVNLKFVKINSDKQAFDIYINGTKLNVTTKSFTAPDTSGKFGFFVKSSGTSSSVDFAELYATQTALDMSGIDYHYELPFFAEKIASNKKIFEINYMMQPKPYVVGINYWDEKNAHGPSLDAFPLKVSYDWYYLTDGNINSNGTKKKPNKMVVNQNSLSYSPVYHSGFRSRFAIVNSSPSQVWIKKSTTDGNNIATVDFSLVTNSLITAGNEVVVERVFDESNMMETVDISSNWVQSKSTALAILKNIYRSLDGFSRDTTISVYGNPLYEIGDVVHIKYNLKNIGENESIANRYFVQAVQQNFSTGLQTILTLNQIA